MSNDLHLMRNRRCCLIIQILNLFLTRLLLSLEIFTYDSFGIFGAYSLYTEWELPFCFN